MWRQIAHEGVPFERDGSYYGISLRLLHRTAQHYTSQGGKALRGGDERHAHASQPGSSAGISASHAAPCPAPPLDAAHPCLTLGPPHRSQAVHCSIGCSVVELAWASQNGDSPLWGCPSSPAEQLHRARLALFQDPLRHEAADHPSTAVLDVLSAGDTGNSLAVYFVPDLNITPYPGFVASSAAEGRAEGWSKMAWALVPWNAKELMPVTDGADGAGATCLGNSRPRPAALLLNVASKCGFNCISSAYFVEYLVMHIGSNDRLGEAGLHGVQGMADTSQTSSRLCMPYAALACGQAQRQCAALRTGAPSLMLRQAMWVPTSEEEQAVSTAGMQSVYVLLASAGPAKPKKYDSLPAATLSALPVTVYTPMLECALPRLERPWLVTMLAPGNSGIRPVTAVIAMDAPATVLGTATALEGPESVEGTVAASGCSTEDANSAMALTDG
ncbi:MAG: hypothetical protein FRX49_03393 [Trebouxia sp. A1-2]|nr:MAG: hypothetical protein FRX49_03393 [Trebouxia sp. A1-2]